MENPPFTAVAFALRCQRLNWRISSLLGCATNKITCTRQGPRQLSPKTASKEAENQWKTTAHCSFWTCRRSAKQSFKLDYEWHTPKPNSWWFFLDLLWSIDFARPYIISWVVDTDTGRDRITTPDAESMTPVLHPAAFIRIPSTAKLNSISPAAPMVLNCLKAVENDSSCSPQENAHAIAIV